MDRNLMRITLFIILILLLIGCASTSNHNFLSSSNDLTKESSNKHFLWKISDENSYVWILGSLHFADSSFYPLDSIIEKAFEKSDELAVEINLNDENVNNEVAIESYKQGFFTSGETLNKVLPLELWNTIDSICIAWNIDSKFLLNMRPWLVATTLSVEAIKRSGIVSTLGIDVYFMDKATEMNKPIVGLESVQDQVNALAETSNSDSLGIYYLQTTLSEIFNLDSMISQMVYAWKTGNEKLLASVMNSNDSMDKSENKWRNKMEDKVYTKRNLKMTESIMEFLKEDRNVFVVIGSAHLVFDKENIIDQLKRKGFLVERY